MYFALVSVPDTQQPPGCPIVSVWNDNGRGHRAMTALTTYTSSHRDLPERSAPQTYRAYRSLWVGHLTVVKRQGRRP
ncbi:hypothetical protein C0Q70_14261 [Pomacea canaliculata]|uniref:Uncharacterized protein n=1 Tax=Pomacea canaliculata TaxID=400727 RepID=A0A2T7NZH8_POMCA|nr:hypothetical protein C0Q70_14261 [Pomacea canaliculata]